MSKSQTQRPSAFAAALLGLIAVCSVVFVGCAGDVGFSAPERTWEEVRYHRSQSLPGDGYRDVTVGSSGEMLLDLQGQRASTRGLLAGENLETLTRLIGALPPAGYAHPGEDGSFFVSLRTGNERRDYATSLSDTEAPEQLIALAEKFETWIEETRENRRVVVPFRVLAEGMASAIASESYQVAQSRDEVIALLSRIGPNGPGVLPAVNFGREAVVGLFLGERPSSGYSISVDVTYRTYTGQLVIKQSRVEPGAGCGLADGKTSPFVLIAVEANQIGDLLVEPMITRTDCGTPAGAPAGPER